MILWCVQGGRHRLRRLAGATLGALLAVAIFGCGRTAPTAFWEPSKDDSAAIKQAVEANKAYFRTGLAELAMTMADTALPGTTAKILNSQMQGDPFRAVPAEWTPARALQRFIRPEVYVHRQPESGQCDAD